MNLMRPLLIGTAGLWFLVGILYPLGMVGISRVGFPAQAAGDPVYWQGRVVAARYVGQFFDQPGYFWGRPSDTVSLRGGRPEPYNALASGASNLGPTNRLLIQHIRERVTHLLATTPHLSVRQIPADLVEGSGSGLDPDISPAAAALQIPRVAKATGLSPGFLRQLVSQATSGPEWGLFGPARVNVTLLNLRIYEVLHGPR